MRGSLSCSSFNKPIKNEKEIDSRLHRRETPPNASSFSSLEYDFFSLRNLYLNVFLFLFLLSLSLFLVPTTQIKKNRAES